MVERSAKTIREWLADWQNTRMCSVLTGHAGNRNAAELTRARKEDLEAVLALPPSRSGIDVEFWDVPALRDVVKILFDVEYESDPSYQLLLRFCGLSFKPPDPFDEHRDEEAITRRMAEVKTQVNHLLEAGWEVYAVDEVRLGERGRDPPHVATQGAAHQVLRGPAESVPVVLRCLVFD
ncbi:hypothetical protein PRAC110570_12540 [Propionibacterium acidifaciens]